MKVVKVVLKSKNGRKIGPDFYTVRKNIYPSFLRRRMVGGKSATKFLCVKTVSGKVVSHSLA